MATKTKAKRIDVVFKKGRWVAEQGGRKMKVGSTKSDLVSSMAKSARSSSKPTNLVIHNKNGRVQEERSYRNGH